MSMQYVARLANRSLLRLSGKDVKSFLQNLVTNDLSRQQEGDVVYAALLTPQGKFLHDFLIIDRGDHVLLDTHAERAADLARRLTMYKLRSDVILEDANTDFCVFALFGDAVGASAVPAEAVLQYQDPRLATLGLRVLAPASLTEDAFTGVHPASQQDYDAHRLSLGVPEGGSDIQPEKNFLLEANFEELQGVSFSKGCYVGQELTARTKHRAKIRKRFLAFHLDGEIEPGDPITANGKEIAVVQGFSRPYGIALTRLKEWHAACRDDIPLSPEGLVISKPEYVVLPDDLDSEEA
ncbi:CAF17-like 4Fe-4S cluster assembly/insertion protein YgfZ [Sneathiella chinensis]|uniref:Glycine cleavage system protein T n=2 Tax=Sneathiella chinensis TaxID=349750 RepID=A0ABQ5U3P4_9PROT|nr:hypothetical protein [Sneathiella chinensis]GLQ05815.1 glycine cleavage system protein T [Sneathiella chinensis]